MKLVISFSNWEYKEGIDYFSYCYFRLVNVYGFNEDDVVVSCFYDDYGFVSCMGNVIKVVFWGWGMYKCFVMIS